MLRILPWMLLLCLFATPLRAQEAEAPAAEAESEQAPAETEPAQPSPEAQAAKAEFDKFHQQWAKLLEQLNALEPERQAAQGDQRSELEQQRAELRAEADKLIDKIVDAGLKVYKADDDAYPEINATLLAVAQFYLIGGRGDGGDQYGKALALVQELLDAGAGEQWPQLYLWGGLAAIGTNQFELAQKYYAKAQETGGAAAGSPPRILETAAQFQQQLPALAKAWQEEQKIREAEAQADDLPRVKLTTTKGDIVLELFENEAPGTVANFITLVKDGFYDGVVFHRVLPGFMAQGGDPTGTGTGGPGYLIPDEHTKKNIRKHFTGSISMAKAQAPNTGGSQFFLTFVPTSFLDGKHTAFGRIIEGQDVAAALRRRDPDGRPPFPEPDRIIKAEVLRDRGHDYEFKKLPGR